MWLSRYDLFAEDETTVDVAFSLNNAFSIQGAKLVFAKSGKSEFQMPHAAGFPDPVVTFHSDALRGEILKAIHINADSIRGRKSRMRSAQWHDPRNWSQKIPPVTEITMECREGVVSLVDSDNIRFVLDDELEISGFKLRRMGDPDDTVTLTFPRLINTARFVTLGSEMAVIGRGLSFNKALCDAVWSTIAENKKGNVENVWLPENPKVA